MTLQRENATTGPEVPALGEYAWTPYGFATVVGFDPETGQIIVEIARDVEDPRRMVPDTEIDSVGDAEWPYGTRDAIGTYR